MIACCPERLRFELTLTRRKVHFENEPLRPLVDCQAWAYTTIIPLYSSVSAGFREDGKRSKLLRSDCAPLVERFEPCGGTTCNIYYSMKGWAVPHERPKTGWRWEWEAWICMMLEATREKSTWNLQVSWTVGDLPKYAPMNIVLPHFRFDALKVSLNKR